jgi:hypothetical protein
MKFKTSWAVQSTFSGPIQIHDQNSLKAAAEAMRSGHGTLGVGGA